MRIALALVPVGIALALAGTAIAATPASHRISVALPGGGDAIIDYQGDVAPRITFAPAATRLPVSFLPAPDWFDDGFVALDRQIDAMMREAGALARLPLERGAAQANFAAFRSMPANATGYSVVTTITGSCTRTVATTILGGGKPPKIVQNTSGDCGAGAPKSGVAPPSTGSEPLNRT